MTNTMTVIIGITLMAQKRFLSQNVALSGLYDVRCGAQIER